MQDNPHPPATMGFEERSRLIFFFLFVTAIVAQVITNQIPDVYGIYNSGSLTLLSGGDPYPAEWRTDEGFTNWFLYPPFFALFFYPFSTAVMGAKAGVICWMLLNLAVFYSGVIKLIDTLGGTSLFRRWRYVVALLLISNELLGAALGVQANLLVTGLMLWGGALYARERFSAAGATLALAVALKIHPIALVLLLALGMQWRFAATAFGLSILFTFLPSAFTGWDPLMKLIGHLGAIFSTDPLHTNYLGIQPMLYGFGWAVPDRTFAIFIFGSAAALALFCLPHAKEPRRLAAVAVPLALSFIILFNKRTEWASFVILSPVLLYMLHAHLSAKDSGDVTEAKTQLTFLLATWIVLSFIASDLCPRPLRLVLSDYKIKGFSGALALMWGCRAALRRQMGRPEKKTGEKGTRY